MVSGVREPVFPGASFGVFSRTDASVGGSRRGASKTHARALTLHRTFHPIQAVTAKGGKYSIQKEASEIDVGDIVFCRVQPKQHFYAHIVHNVHRHYVQRPQYSIGNIQGHINGWCYREHIFGILVDVQVFSDGQYYSRPHPKKLFEKVSALVVGENADRWNGKAGELCAPSREPPSSGAQSSGQQGCNS